MSTLILAGQHDYSNDVLSGIDRLLLGELSQSSFADAQFGIGISDTFKIVAAGVSSASLAFKGNLIDASGWRFAQPPRPPLQRHGGELRYDVVGAFTFILGDANGDGIADFEIDLAGRINLQATDFVL
jgi:hypothetical protein